MRVRTSRASVISIHAPRTGSDKANGHSQFKQSISIHAPRTGSDHVMDPEQTVQRHFNPRSPHGERRCAADGSFLAE